MLRTSLSRLVQLSLVGSILTATVAGAAVTKTFHDTRALPSGTAFALENVNGSVTIDVWDRQEVDINAILSAEDDEALRSIDVEVSSHGNKLVVETRHARGDRWGHRKVDYVVKVPRNARLDGVTSVNGDVEITGVEGGVAASTVNGTLAMMDIGGAIDAETVNGDMTLAVAAGADVESIEAEAVNGRIDISLPRSMGLSVEAETLNGRLNGNLGLEVERPKYGPGRSMRGRVGSGEVRLEVETVNGSISIEQN